jgi:hypothetical protein
VARLLGIDGVRAGKLTQAAHSWDDGCRRSRFVGVRPARRPAGVRAAAPEFREGARLVDREAPGDRWRIVGERSTEG